MGDDGDDDDGGVVDDNGGVVDDDGDVVDDFGDGVLKPARTTFDFCQKNEKINVFQHAVFDEHSNPFSFFTTKKQTTLFFDMLFWTNAPFHFRFLLKIGINPGDVSGTI